MRATQLHLSQRLEGEGGRCIDKGGVLPMAGSEKFRVITDILSSDEQGTESEGESGKYDTCVGRKPLADRNSGNCAVAVITAADSKKNLHCVHPNKSVQIQSRRGEVSFANPVSHLFCNLTRAQIVASVHKK